MRREATLKMSQGQLDALKARPMSANDSIAAAMIDGAIRSELQDIAAMKANVQNRPKRIL